MFSRILIMFIFGSSFVMAQAPSAKQEINILFVGKTQTGKSSLVNIFYNHIIGNKFEDERAVVIPLLDGADKLFVNVEKYFAYDVELRDLNQSQTTKVLRYTAENSRYIVHLWDAPGFNDTNRQVTDEEVVKSIATAIGETSFNAVAVVLKPNEPNSFDMMANINRIRTMLPKSASKNIIGIYTRAANLSKGVRKSGAIAFANLLQIPQGATLPNVYHVDGSSFFSEVDLGDFESLAQGQARWLGDAGVVRKVINDAAAIEPFDASDVLAIQNTIEELEKKIDTRKSILESLDETVSQIQKLTSELTASKNKREENKQFDKEKTLVIEKEVAAYERHFYTLWIWRHEAGTEKEYHQGTAKYTDEEQRLRYLAALDEIEAKNNDIGLQENEKSRFAKEETQLLEELVALEKKRRNLALSSDLDSFLVYLNEQIRKAQKNPDEKRGQEQVTRLQDRRDNYERLKSLDKHIREEL